MWKDLTMSQRADMMDLYLSKGITSLDDMRSLYDSSISDTAQGTSFSSGGSIHIDPSKKGTFTAAAKKHGMGVQEFASRVLANKDNYSPAMVKKANFARNASKWHGYGGHIYDGLTEDSQQMNAPYAGELPEVTVRPRKIVNKAWDKVYERWVGDMPTYYAANPETGKEEMLREIGNGKYSTYDDRHVFDVLGAEAAKKEREQWVRNGGTAGDFDKVMLGSLGLGVAPIALPEIAVGALTPTGQTLLAGTLSGETWETLNQGITGQSWGDNLGDVVGLDKDNYLGRAALGLTNPFYSLSPNMVYKGGEAVLEGLTKPMWNVGKKSAYSIATRTPQITAENAASMTPKQWTAAQDAAIARGDMVEAQRLRDLHFKVSAPETKIIDEKGNPLHLYHGTKNRFNAFDESLYGSTDGGMYGTGVYTTPYRDYAENYGNNIMDLYANIINPVDARNLSIDDLMLGKLEEGNNIFRWTDIGGKKDGVLGKNHYLNTKYPYEVVSHKPSKVKAADAVTYDDNGVRIPLGERDNFSINDIRYGLIPFGIGLTGYGLYNSEKEK